MTTKELKKKYIDFIDWLDPYNEDAGLPEDERLEQSLDDMLYNLIEIRKDWGFNNPSEEWEVQAAIMINDLLLRFRDAGFKVVV